MDGAGGQVAGRTGEPADERCSGEGRGTGVGVCLDDPHPQPLSQSWERGDDTATRSPSPAKRERGLGGEGRSGGASMPATETAKKSAQPVIRGTILDYPHV